MTLPILPALPWLQAALTGRLLAASVDLLVLAPLAALAARCWRRSPRLVSLLWLLVMLKPLVSLLAGPPLPVALPAPGVADLADLVRNEEVVRQATPHGLEEHVSSFRSFRSSRSPQLLLGPLWLLGLGVLAATGAWNRARLRRLLAAARPAPEALQARLRAVALRLGVRRLPALWITEALESPALARVARPVILVPAWLVAEGSPAQLDWSLGHELIHAKHRDPWAGAVRQLVQILFFFHPLAWWVGRRWEEAAELACDRALVASAEEALSYAERLYEILVKARGRRRAALAGGLFATRTQIGRRIAALLRDPMDAPAHPRRAGAAALAVLALASLSVGAAWRQELHSRRIDLELTEPRERLALTARGTFALTPGGSLEGFTPGTFVRVEQQEEGVLRQAELTARADGTLDRVYRVGGRARPFDGAAEAWMARILSRFALR